MVTAGHEPISAADDIMADLLALELRKLLAGRSIGDAVAVVMAVNAALARRAAEAAEPTVH